MVLVLRCVFVQKGWGSLHAALCTLVRALHSLEMGINTSDKLRLDLEYVTTLWHIACKQASSRTPSSGQRLHLSTGYLHRLSSSAVTPGPLQFFAGSRPSIHSGTSDDAVLVRPIIIIRSILTLRHCAFTKSCRLCEFFVLDSTKTLCPLLHNMDMSKVERSNE